VYANRNKSPKKKKTADPSVANSDTVVDSVATVSLVHIEYQDEW